MFTGTRGINLTRPFAGPWCNSQNTAYLPDPYQYLDGDKPRKWADMKASGALDAIKRAGFDHVRLPVNPGPMVTAKLANDTAGLNTLIAQTVTAVNDILAAGLGVVYDIHPSTWAGLPVNWISLTSGDLTNAQFVALIAVEGAIAAALPPGNIALEVFNEPPPPAVWTVSWESHAKALCNAVRGAAPGLTIIVGSASWYDVWSMNTMNPATFDANTLFTVHCYEPRAFTYQGLPGNTEYHLRGVAWPPVAGDKAGAISRMTAAVYAESTVTDKVGKIASLTTVLNTYFAAPQPATLAGLFDGVATWADSKGLERSRIYVGEFGVNRPENGGACEVSRAAYFKDAKTIHTDRGFRWAVFDYDVSDFGIHARLSAESVKALSC